MISNQSNFRLNHVCGHHPKEQRIVYACDVSWVFPSYLSMSNVDGLPCMGCLLLGAFGQMKQHSQTRKRNSPKLRMTYHKYIKSISSLPSNFGHHPPPSILITIRLAHLRLKSHVQHSIGLVHHEVTHTLQARHLPKCGELKERTSLWRRTWLRDRGG